MYTPYSSFILLLFILRTYPILHSAYHRQRGWFCPTISTMVRIRGSTLFAVSQVKQTRSSSGVGGGGETGGGGAGRVRGSARGGPLLRAQVASARHLERLMAARGAARLTHGDLQHQHQRALVERLHQSTRSSASAVAAATSTHQGDGRRHSGEESEGERAAREKEEAKQRRVRLRRVQQLSQHFEQRQRSRHRRAEEQAGFLNRFAAVAATATVPMTTAAGSQTAGTRAY